MQAVDQATDPPAAVIERARARSLAYQEDAATWTCDETIRRAEYDDAGEASRDSERGFSLLLVRSPLDGHPVEMRSAPGESAEVRRPRALEHFPPITAWLQLFDPRTSGFAFVEDERTPAPAGLRSFAFRGSLPWDDGGDIREWDGSVEVDPSTGDLVAIHAIPAAQAERLQELVTRRNSHGIAVRFFVIFGFDLGPRAVGRNVEISFARTGSGHWLPAQGRFETFEATTHTTTRRLTAVIETLGPCRRFRVTATPDETLAGLPPP